MSDPLGVKRRELLRMSALGGGAAALGGFAFGSGDRATVVWPAFYAGARFHFTDRITLTMRVGYPDFSLGVSFLL